MNYKEIYDLYNEALEYYKNNKRPNNYIPRYIKSKLKYKITNEELHKIIFQNNKNLYCEVCGKKIPYTKFGQIKKTCSIKCSHNTDDYKIKISNKLKGKTKSTKGKTYKEIYGTSNPKCGFKKDNLNISKLLEIRKKISEGVKKSYTDELRNKRREQAYKTNFINSSFKKNILDDYGNNFRSKLEAQFSNLMIKNKINYKYEKNIKLINNHIKIVDFVIDNIFIEITGYAYKNWQDDLDDKIILLRKSLKEDDIIILITYKDKLDLLLKNGCEKKFGHNVFIIDIENEEKILKTIKFSKEIYSLNKKLKELK